MLTDKQLPTFARMVVRPFSESSSASGIAILDHEDGNKTFFRNAGNYYSAETASHSRRLKSDKHIYEKLLKTGSTNKSVSSKIKASARSEVLRVALLKVQLFWDSNCVAW